jgi:hypothetical protein
MGLWGVASWSLGWDAHSRFGRRYHVVRGNLRESTDEGVKP